MEVFFIFCLTCLPSPMKTTQKMGASIYTDEKLLEKQLSESELGSIDSNENFNRDRLHMDAEEADLINR